jgi:uncharacterized protein (TIGR02453 family)
MINPKLLTFLRSIKKNNKKEWYDEHKDQYKILRDEFTELMGQIRDEVATFDKAVASSHKKGIKTVKVFRLHRDTRFSRNKTKYKTAISGLISADVKNPLEPVYYFAVEPDGKSFIGGGIRTPERQHLDSVRDYISAHYKKLHKILNDEALVKYFPQGLSNEFKLKKAPQGYEVTHPAIELLRYKNFTIGESLLDEELKNPKIKNTVSEQFKSLAQINEFLRAAGK